MNITNTTILTMGGSNSLYLINIISRNISNKIIRNSDLNGCIDPYDVNVWHVTSSNYNSLCQDNIQNTFLLYNIGNNTNTLWGDKSYNGGDWAPWGGNGMFFQFSYKE